MSLAYRHSLKPIKTINWSFATLRQNAIGRGGDLGLIQRKQIHAGLDDE
jgi:hypothetical protein